MSDKTSDPGLAPLRPKSAVLHMVDFDHGNGARIINELRTYWRGLRQGRAVPLRSDVEPQGIRGALDYSFILERVAPGAARFRLAGQHLIDLMGMEVRGMPLCTFLNAPSRGRLSDVLETVFRAPQMAELTLKAGPDYGRPALQGRMLLLPLRSDLGDVTRALGCLIAEGDMGSAPRRFDLIEDQVTPVIEGAQTLHPSPSARGFQEQPAHWKSAPAPAATDLEGRQPSTDIPESPEDKRARFRIISSRD